MTLDEAIKHCEEKSCGSTQCNQEHKQLADWLKELKKFKEEKEVFEEVRIKAFHNGYRQGLFDAEIKHLID